MRGTSTFSCERCGDSMKTSVGSKSRRWRAKLRDPEETLKCSPCRTEVADASKRGLDLDIDYTTEGGLKVELNFINETDEVVYFGMSHEPDEVTQWTHEDRWDKAMNDAYGVVGLLYILDVEGNMVFEHVIRRRNQGQMSADGTFPNGLEAVWSYPDARENYFEWEKYSVEAKSSPLDYSELTVCFDLLANPRSEWPVSYVEKQISVSDFVAENI